MREVLVRARVVRPMVGLRSVLWLALCIYIMYYICCIISTDL